MTALTVTEEETIAQGWAAYHRVKCTRWPAGKADEVREALQWLVYALETHRDVLTRVTDPSDAYFELEPGDDARGQALHMAAADVAEWTADLDRLVPVAAEEVAA